MRNPVMATMTAVAMTFLAAPVLAADDAKPAVPSAASSAGDMPDLPPLPPQASVRLTSRGGGRTLAYTATVGALPVRDDKGKMIAEVVFTAYTLDGPRDPNRPVTFAFNGGPGAASVYLNLGAIGPKRIEFGAAGDTPSDPARAVDNAGTWLDFTDLVFIDPVGTGFSRSLVSLDEAKKAFYATRAGHRISVAHRVRLAGQERPHGLAQIRRGRKLRRLPRTADHPLSADHARRRDQRAGAGLAVSGRGRPSNGGLSPHELRGRPCRRSPPPISSARQRPDAAGDGRRSRTMPAGTTPPTCCEAAPTRRRSPGW